MYRAVNNVYERSPASADYLTSNKKQLYRTINNGKKNITQTRLHNYLLQKEPYTLTRRVVRNFRRNHYYVYGPFQLHEADLVDMTMYSTENDGYKYLLTVIDAFSKYAYVMPVKTKGGRNVAMAYRRILDDSAQSPKVLQTDRGLEFKNAFFKALLQTRGIKLQHPLTTSKLKCAIVENFNKTLKLKMFRFFTHKGGNYRRYIDVLSDLVKSYNNTVHSVTKYRPVDVTFENAIAVYHNTHMRHKKEPLVTSPQKLQPGDYVRVALKSTALDRGVMKDQWSKEIFTVAKVMNKKPNKMYRLHDFKNNPLNGAFYVQELQKIILPGDTVMRVLHTKGLGANKKQYVLYNGTRKWI